MVPLTKGDEPPLLGKAGIKGRSENVLTIDLGRKRPGHQPWPFASLLTDKPVGCQSSVRQATPGAAGWLPKGTQRYTIEP